jgi:hypothetical protein
VPRAAVLRKTQFLKVFTEQVYKAEQKMSPEFKNIQTNNN